jgi:hypothetical protein
MREHETQRFLVPPFVFVSLVVLAIVFVDPKPAWWNNHTLHALVKAGPLFLAIVAFLTANVAIFAMGFFIASIAIFFTRLLALVLRRPKGFSTGWSDEAKEAIQKKYHFRNFNAEAEQCEQCFVGDVASPLVQDWMHRRWEQYVLNINSASACFVAIGTACAFHLNTPALWVAALVSAALFLFNGYQARREVIDMDNFLVRNLDMIHDLRLAMGSSDSGGHAESGDASHNSGSASG